MALLSDAAGVASLTSLDARWPNNRILARRTTGAFFIHHQLAESATAGNRLADIPNHAAGVVGTGGGRAITVHLATLAVFGQTEIVETAAFSTEEAGQAVGKVWPRAQIADLAGGTVGIDATGGAARHAVAEAA